MVTTTRFYRTWLALFLAVFAGLRMAHSGLRVDAERVVVRLASARRPAVLAPLGLYVQAKEGLLDTPIARAMTASLAMIDCLLALSLVALLYIIGRKHRSSLPRSGTPRSTSCGRVHAASRLAPAVLCLALGGSHSAGWVETEFRVRRPATSRNAEVIAAVAIYVLGPRPALAPFAVTHRYASDRRNVSDFGRIDVWPSHCLSDVNDQQCTIVTMKGRGPPETMQLLRHVHSDGKRLLALGTTDGCDEHYAFEGYVAPGADYERPPVQFVDRSNPAVHFDSSSLLLVGAVRNAASWYHLLLDSIFPLWLSSKVLKGFSTCELSAFDSTLYGPVNQKCHACAR